MIVAFMMYIRLFTQPLSQFAQAFQNLQRCAAAAERVFGFLEEPEMEDESGKQALLGKNYMGKVRKVLEIPYHGIENAVKEGMEQTTLASMSEKFCGLVNCRRISNIEVSSSASGSTS